LHLRHLARPTAKPKLKQIIIVAQPSIQSRLSSHEEVCAFRYEQINARLKRLEGIIIKACGALLIGMSGVIWTFLLHTK
jgi:hypothetical protein